MPTVDALVSELLAIMARLRDPEHGCPWDQQQNFTSIAPYTIEEAFEVAEAIARKDYPELREELGDLLLQVVFHAQMADEQGLFDFADVVATLNQKMVRRHPHVFAERLAEQLPEQQGATLDSVKQRWEQIKQQERADKGHQHDSALDGVPAGLPGLQRAMKLQKKAAKVGFDWPSMPPVRAQLQAELVELDQALALADRDAIEDEFGDVLFTLVNLSRHLKLDAEQALRRASAKFERRFRDMEELAAVTAKPLDSMAAEQLEQLWRKVKLAEAGETNKP